MTSATVDGARTRGDTRVVPVSSVPDPVSAVVFLTLVLAAVSVVPIVFNLVGRWLWDDWLDERLGRGSVKDEFPRRHW